MASTLTRLKVKDFTQWKKVYESLAEKRVSSGGLSAQVYQDAADPNSVIVLGKWKSLEDARKWVATPELKAGIEQAGVLEAPVFTFLNEV